MARRTAAQIKAETEATVTPVLSSSMAEALFALQGVMPAFQTDEVNPHLHNKYTSINALLPKLMVMLRAHGILLEQSVTHVDGAGALRTRLTHMATGETREDVAMLSADKATPQAQGSAITYMRRYSLVTMLNLIIEKDDDGHAGSTPTTFKSTPTEPPVYPAAPAAGFGQASTTENPFGAAL